MMETIAILLVFFLLLILGFIFYIKTTKYSSQQKISQTQEFESIKVSQETSFLPELQCSSKNIINENCFDKYKLNAFVNLPNNEENYYHIFYYSNIIVKEIYPGNSTWSLYTRTSNASSYLTSIPILLYNATDKTNAFGLLTVRYYTIN